MEQWTCPGSGVWRAWLDAEPTDFDSTHLREHLHGCSACASIVSELVQSAAEVSRALALIGPDVPVSEDAAEVAA
jgi:predicted anti-sigma-YlaC factor YlaD